MTLLLYALVMIVGGSGALPPYASGARSPSATALPCIGNIAGMAAPGRHEVMLAGNAMPMPRWSGTKQLSGLFAARSGGQSHMNNAAATHRAGWLPAVYVVDDAGAVRTIAIECSL